MPAGPPLDAPPPAPGTAPPGQGMEGLVPPSGAGPNPAPGDPNSSLVAMAAEIDRALTVMAGSMPDSGPEIQQAKSLIQVAMAKHLSMSGGAPPSTSPTAVGGQFTGGGMGNGIA